MAKNITSQSESFNFLQDRLRDIALLPAHKKPQAYSEMRETLKDQAKMRGTSYKELARNIDLNTTYCESILIRAGLQLNSMRSLAFTHLFELKKCRASDIAERIPLTPPFGARGNHPTGPKDVINAFKHCALRLVETDQPYTIAIQNKNYDAELELIDLTDL